MNWWKKTALSLVQELLDWNCWSFCLQMLLHWRLIFQCMILEVCRLSVENSEGEFPVRHGYSSYEHVEQVLVQPRTETDFHFLDHSVCLKDHISSTMDSLRYILTWNTHMLPLYGHSTSLPTHHCCKICVLNFLILCLLGLWPNSWVIHCPSVSINTYLRPHFSQHNSSYLNTHQKDLQSTLFFKNYS